MAMRIPVGGDAITVSFRDALDEAVQAQATELVGDASGGEVARLFAEQWSPVLAQVLVGKVPPREQTQEHHVQESVHAWIVEAQRRGALLVHHHGCG